MEKGRRQSREVVHGFLPFTGPYPLHVGVAKLSDDGDHEQVFRSMLIHDLGMLRNGKVRIKCS